MSSPVDITPLLTPDGWALLDSLPEYQEAQALELSARLRAQGHDPALVAAALSQAKLRQRARPKFGEITDRLLFTPAGIEQATRMEVAQLHAARFDQLGVRTLADLGCGIGADALAFAATGMEVSAVEADTLTADIATFNLASYPNVNVIHGLAEDFLSALEAKMYDGVWLDPARRHTHTSGTTRLFDPTAFSPPWSFVHEVAATGVALGIKLGPSLEHALIPEGAEALWLSVEGTVLEVCLWFNGAKREQVRRGALIARSGQLYELSSPTLDSAPAPVGEIGSYLYEPDGAIIRSHLVSDLARELDAWLLDPHIAYLSSGHYVPNPFSTVYRVLDSLPFKTKTLKKWVRENGIGVLDIKKRGLDVTPEQLRATLLAGVPKTARGKATLVLVRMGDTRRALVVEPCSAG